MYRPSGTGGMVSRTGPSRRSSQAYEYGVSTFMATMERSVGSASARLWWMTFRGALNSGEAGSRAKLRRIR